MRAATGAGLVAAGSIAQMVCRVDMCLVVLIVGIMVADSGKVGVNRVPEVSFYRKPAAQIKHSIGQYY
jgi:hypothetical protein